MSELKSYTNELLRDNIKERLIFIKDNILVLGRFIIKYRNDENLSKVLKYYREIIKKYYSFIVNEREILLFIKKNTRKLEETDYTADVLEQLQDYMEVRYNEYDDILLKYDDLAIYENLNSCNYHIDDPKANVDDKQMNKILELLKIELTK